MNELNQDKAVEAIRNAEIFKDFAIATIITNKGNEIHLYISQELYKLYADELTENGGEVNGMGLHNRFMHLEAPNTPMVQDGKVMYMYNGNYAVGSLKRVRHPAFWNADHPNEKPLGFVLGIVAVQEECLQARQKVIELEQSVKLAITKAERRQSFETYAAIPELHDLVKSYDLDKDLFK